MSEERKNTKEFTDTGARGAGPGPAAQNRTGGKEKKEKDLPPIDFSTFILSLSTSALMSLGEIENPVTKRREKELPVAKQTIDIIAILKEKTRGNLNDYESRLIDSVLTDLRIRYVRAVESK